MDIDEIYAVVGRRIKLIRRWRRLSQFDLSRQIGMSRASITNIEGGNQHLPIDTLHRLSVVFGMPLHGWFLPEDQWLELCRGKGVKIRRKEIRVVECVVARNVSVEVEEDL